jgi:peroxiredoxin
MHERGYCCLMDERQIPSVGEKAPAFTLADSTGVVRRLDDLVADGLCIVVFYRGHW